jgi:hypothetical protein|nr:MAG TPA: hypothetical protein [Caudoviricetes sp.]
MRLGNKLVIISQEDFTLSGKMNKKEKTELDKFNSYLNKQKETLSKTLQRIEEPFDLRYLFSKRLVEFPRIRTTNPIAIYQHQRSILFSLIYERIKFIENLISTKDLTVFIESEKKMIPTNREVIPSFLLNNSLVYTEETFTLIGENHNEEVEVVSLIEEGKLNKNLVKNLIDFGLNKEEFVLPTSLVKLIESFQKLNTQFENELDSFGLDKEIVIGSNFGDKKPLSGYLGSISSVDEFKTLINLINKKKLIMMLKEEIDVILNVIL